jgi:hypothetical protein
MERKLTLANLHVTAQNKFEQVDLISLRMKSTGGSQNIAAAAEYFRLFMLFPAPQEMLQTVT